MNGWPHSKLSRALLAGLVGLAAGAGLAFLEPLRLPWGLALSPAALPLVLYVALCFAAPFFPVWSFFLPIVTRGPRERPAVALTFDDGPDPRVTPALLDLLARYGARAAFFVVGRNAEAHPEVMARIRAAGHEVGNHSLSHDPILMLRSARLLQSEIAACQAILQRQGVTALAFRPPVGITNPRLPPVLERLGLGCVCFSCRPLDFGNRRVAGLAAKVLGSVAPGDVVLLHDVMPGTGVTVEDWLSEIEKILVGLQARGLKPVALSQLIGRPLMVASGAVDGAGAPVARPAAEGA
ncbi:MAG: polysaccharide deacetylase family protein [Deltaproteobacteria bacterium]|nr:polysaccharide deacetylase family protein [Deltaproteobacteria bacterium]